MHTRIMNIQRKMKDSAPLSPNFHKAKSYHQSDGNGKRVKNQLGLGMPLIPALRRQRQVDLCEFETSLVNTASSRATQRNPVSKKKNKKKKKNKRIS